jgi:hypothetical protein
MFAVDYQWFEITVFSTKTDKLYFIFLESFPVKILKLGVLISSLLCLSFAIPAVANDYGKSYQNSELYRKICNRHGCHYVKVGRQVKQQVQQPQIIHQEVQKSPCPGRYKILSRDEHGTKYRCFIH